MSRGSHFAALLAGIVLALAAPAVAEAAQPVPSLQPKATAKLWHRLVQQRHTASRNADCSRLLFYAATDWLRLATKLAANQSPCAQYYISIPPLAADKTTFRPDQPWRIRALGANFHAVAEISYNGWGSWVAANGSTWYAAGVEARRRMAAQGFDIASGDRWVVNESSSAVRTGTGAARQNLRDLVRGLYEGGAGPQVKGAVFVVGVGQSALSLSTYQGTLQLWYADTPFWADMNAYVSDWSQEVYGDIRNYAVPGAPPETRRDELNAWLQHPLALANAGPPEIATARAFLQGAYSPLANAAWRYPSGAGFGWTDVPFDQMQDYVSAQTYALGSAGSHFGFAWHPNRPDGVSVTQFATESDAVLDRMAASIHDPATACAASCALAIAGASFNEGWHDLAIVGDAEPRNCERACVGDGGRAVRAADCSTADRRHYATRHAAGDGDPHVDVTTGRLLEQRRRAVDEHARHPDRRGIDRGDVLLPRHQGRHCDACRERARPGRRRGGRDREAGCAGETRGDTGGCDAHIRRLARVHGVGDRRVRQRNRAVGRLGGVERAPLLHFGIVDDVHSR